jgi:long-chain fatty acid transport protein
MPAWWMRLLSTVQSMRRSLLAASLVAALPATALADGLNHTGTPLGARARGLGGAFVAVADDPTALHYNPAGLASQPESVYVDLGATYATQSFQVVANGAPVGTEQEADAALGVIPALGYVVRPGDGRLTLGAGLWRTFGNESNYLGGAIPGSVSSQLYELVPGAAFQVSELLELGVALRFGLGTHDAEGDLAENPIRGQASASGIGFGASFGATLRPTPALRVAASWRSGMTLQLSGDGLAVNPMPTGPDDAFLPVGISIEQRWPQQAALGVAWDATEAILVSAQLDWTDWSTVDRVVYSADPLPGIPDDLSTSTLVDMEDVVAVRVGGRYVLSQAITLSAGYALTTAATQDRTSQRHYVDGLSHELALGGGIRLTDSLWLDLGAGLRLMNRSVPDNRAVFTAAGWPERANRAPADYKSTTLAFETGLLWRY